MASAGLLALRSGDVQAQSPTVRRLGWLGVGGTGGRFGYESTFIRALQSHGLVEGKHFVVESREAEDGTQPLLPLARELVGRNVDVIVADSTLAAIAAQRATASIPIVVLADDADARGLVQTLSRPGGNVTGLSGVAADLVAKQVSLLKEASPRLSHLILILHAAEDWPTETRTAVQKAVASLRLTLTLIDAKGRADIDRAFAPSTREGGSGIVTIASHMALGWQIQIARLGVSRKVPVVSDSPYLTWQGGLLSYGPSFPALRERLAYFVVRVLKGARPADLPMERPSQFELLLNAGTARALGLSVPASLRLRADQVID